jgi:hypothetical protein
VAGTVDLGGATLVLAGAHVPAAGNTFVIVNNKGASAIVGTFAGLAEGATILFNGKNLRISYVGGVDGNDVVLKEPSPTAARLAYFRATEAGAGQVALSWGTLVEVGTLGFHVERARSDGGWERVTGQLIAATGWDQRPQKYAATDSAPTGVIGAKYRLLEVDLRGQESVLAEATASAAARASAERTATGLSLQLRGGPNGTVVVELATAVTGPWTEVVRVPLDDKGTATLTLGAESAEGAGFYRVFSE